MYALCLDTTGPSLIVGLSNFETVCRYQSWDLGREISTHLQTHLATFLLPQHWSDLEWLAVAKGPGSFMGSRIGVVTARTLAQQLQVPLFSLSTLAVSAWVEVQQHCYKEEPVRVIAVEMPAQQGSIYGALYRMERQTSALAPLFRDRQMSLEEWEDLLQTQPLLHNRIKAPIRNKKAEDISQALLALAYQQWQWGDRPTWQEALPYYG